MIERATRIISENLARALDRRTFLRRAGEVTFVGMAALAAGRITPAHAMTGISGQPPQPVPLVPRCAPPGPYCNLNGVNEPNGCHGASCFQHRPSSQVVQCTYYYIYQAGCSTTPDPTIGGYWTCCDCRCSDNSTCGCAQHSSQPIPRPDGPQGGVGAGEG